MQLEFSSASIAIYDGEFPEVVFPEVHYLPNNGHHLTHSNCVGSTHEPKETMNVWMIIIAWFIKCLEENDSM